ncbi:MAG: hypothetical protein K9H84_08140 [Bacteroidales bacterium]|nr:hypothetical protein [Bacteroidales bacterium]
MKKLILVLFVLVTGFGSLLKAQQQEEKKFGISWSGFVKNDFFYDSRQTISAREGQFLLYPAPVNEDFDGQDINARGSINFLSIQSRVTGSITGPEAFGAKTSGKIEGAFFGHSNPDINGFRLRHAFVKLDWGKTQLLTGQYWHMMFAESCFPGTVSFNTGVPFQYFSRNPQIRLSHQLHKAVSLTVAAATQRDFSSPGGYSSLSNSMIPDMHARLKVNITPKLLFGATAGYKKMMPRLSTTKGYQTDKELGSATANAFLRLDMDKFTVKMQGIYAQNAFDGLMIGGFAIQDITDTVKDFREYTPVNTFSTWIDMHTNGKKFKVGLFGGYTQNLGTTDKVSQSIFDPQNTTGSLLYDDYARGTNISHVFRVSPRVLFNSGKFRFAAECEYTVAAYAEKDDSGNLQLEEKLKVTDYQNVQNIRVLLATYYFF